MTNLRGLTFAAVSTLLFLSASGCSSASSGACQPVGGPCTDGKDCCGGGTYSDADAVNCFQSTCTLINEICPRATAACSCTGFVVPPGKPFAGTTLSFLCPPNTGGACFNGAVGAYSSCGARCLDCRVAGSGGGGGCKLNKVSCPADNPCFAGVTCNSGCPGCSPQCPSQQPFCYPDCTVCQCPGSMDYQPMSMCR